MSYLDVPRIHLGGRFYTYPSTVNNDPTHFDPANTNPSPWQTPKGTHWFQFKDCTVRSVVSDAGPDPNDSIIGATAVTTDLPSPAKIVDLDVYQQNVPTIYGLQLKITLAGGASVTGTMDPAVLNQLWWLSVQPTRSWSPGDYAHDSFGGDMNATGAFQSILRVKPQDWQDTGSAVLRQLKSVTRQENGEYLISFKYVLDGYENVQQNANFLTGRMVGTLGPVKANEPKYNPGQRWLVARASPQKTGPSGSDESDPWYYPAFYDCPFKVDRERKKLVLDLAVGITRQTAGGEMVDLGTVTAYIGNLDPPNVPVGTVDYSSFSYANNALITEIDLTDEQIQLLETNGLVLVTSKNDIGPSALFQEDITKLNYCVEVRPLRMSGTPGSAVTTDIYVNRLGVPVSGKQMGIQVNSVTGKTKGITTAPTNPGNTPQADGAVTANILPTNQYGFAQATAVVQKNPGKRTTQLDGQLYFIVVYDPDGPVPNVLEEAPDERHLISLVAFEEYPVNTNPTWEEIVAIMTPYSKLYPYMKGQMDLIDAHTFSVFSNNPPWFTYKQPPQPPDPPRVGPLGIVAGAIPWYMSFPFNDTRYMPVSRDLSYGRMMTVMHYIKNLQDGTATLGADPADTQNA